jgi:hypothetical protein
MAILATSPSGCGCRSAQSLPKGAVRAGPAIVEPQPGGSCSVQSLPSVWGAAMFVTDCPSTVTNVGSRPLLLFTVEGEIQMPGGQAGLSWRTMPVGAWHVKADGVMGALQSGESLSLPAPQTGDIGWVVMAVDPVAMHRAAITAAAIAVLGGAGLTVGAYALGVYVGRRRDRDREGRIEYGR